MISLGTWRGAVEFHRWKVEVTMLKDREKVKCQNVAPLETDEQHFWSNFGGIAQIQPAPVEGQRSHYKVKGQVVPPGG